MVWAVDLARSEEAMGAGPKAQATALTEMLCDCIYRNMCG